MRGRIRAVRRAWLALVVAALVGASLALVPGAGAGAQGGSPFGFVDQLVHSPAGVTFGGWAIDPDTGAPIDVHLYRNGGFLGAVRADGARPDVAAVHPGFGAGHGWSAVLDTPEGTHRFCAYAINVGAGAPYVELGCQTLVVSHAPIGTVDVVQRIPGTGGIQVAGWALDPDSYDPVDIHLYLNDQFIGAVRSDRPRPDVGANLPWTGGDVGYDVSFALWEGRHRLCAYAIGAGPGAPWSGIGCREIDFPSAPIGVLESARVGDSSVRVGGWALDPDVVDPVRIDFWIDGYFSGSVMANEGRADVLAGFPAYGAAHGFGATLYLWPGAANVCAYAINLAEGPAYSGLGCRALDPMPPPGSGGGRRIVYANLSQRLWLVGADGFVDRTYPISGKYLDPVPGTYAVYTFIRYASAGHDGITMDYFVGFNPAGLGYGFHTIPVFADGTPLQGENELGFFRSAGCVRQRFGDAVFMWNWAQYGDPVVVLAA